MSRPMNKTPAWQWPVVVFWQLTASSIGRSAVNTAALGCDSLVAEVRPSPILGARRYLRVGTASCPIAVRVLQDVVGDREHLWLAGIGGCASFTTNMFGSDVGAASDRQQKTGRGPTGEIHSTGADSERTRRRRGLTSELSAVCWACFCFPPPAAAAACWAASALPRRRAGNCADLAGLGGRGLVGGVGGRGLEVWLEHGQIQRDGEGGQHSYRSKQRAPTTPAAADVGKRPTRDVRFANLARDRNGELVLAIGAPEKPLVGFDLELDERCGARSDGCGAVVERKRS